MFLAWCVWILSGLTPNASFKGLFRCWTKESHQPLFWHMCSSSLTNRCCTSHSAGTIIQRPSNTWSSSGNHMGLMMVCSNRNGSPLTRTQSCQDFKQPSPQRFCKVHSFTVVLKSEFLFVQAGACVYTTGLAWNSSPPALWISCVNNAVVSLSSL